MPDTQVGIYGSLFAATAIIVGLLIHARRTVQRDIRQHQENMKAAREAEERYAKECCHDR